MTATGWERRDAVGEAVQEDRDHRRMHDDELAISEEIARVLVANQFPEWAGQPISRLSSSGTVNAIFRIGDELTARFPLRAAEADETLRFLRAEAAAMAEFARVSPVPAPLPVAIGEPGPGYGLPWSVQTWVPGVLASDEEVSGSNEFARDLANLITVLRSLDTAGRRFAGMGRGGELTAHDEWVEHCLVRSEGLFDLTQLRDLWSRFRLLPRVSNDVMTHGDLLA